MSLSLFLNPNLSLFNDYSLINDYLSLKKYKFKMLMWKIVRASPVLVLYIYIDYVFLNPTIKGCSPFGYGK